MDSMEQVYRDHAKMVYGFLLSKTGDADAAEEMTQETFFRAVRCIGSFKGDSSIATWLCGIAKNVYLDSLRGRKAKVGLEEAEGFGELSVDSAETVALRSLEHLRLLKLMHGLEEPAREVLYLRLMGGLSFRQIGEIFDRTENWARVTYYRGKERILKEAERK